MEDKTQKILDVVEEHENAEREKKEDSLEYKIHQNIGKIFEEHNIEAAAVVFEMPESKAPALYFQGHYYDAAKLLALALRQLKSQIADELA